MTEEPVTSIDRTADEVTVTLRGEVDVLNVDQVRVALVEALETKPQAVVVELSQLSFIDSTGLGAIIFGFQRARDEGIDFHLRRPTRGVHQVLVLSGLLEVVGIKD